MKRIVAIALGFLLGVLVTFIGSAIFVYFSLRINPLTQFKLLLYSGSLGKILVIGSVLNLILFWYFIKKNQDLKAGGTILAAVILTILTQLV
ncbi:hypothetical protein [Flavobacterium sp. NKUCC04_CG]|uniref:hypothetical protein n=1 Tax=Flavobacterium sp. NKUCC04_CG TaxID=2842121 RepID=UPI001C5B6B73|nr:hypothetical protein [Flavobacterium sp. NKUCC04_CG]MBW3518996.1 hypothetical protein [Flavobacterium sp. NKUCC04_CG]